MDKSEELYLWLQGFVPVLRQANVLEFNFAKPILHHQNADLLLLQSREMLLENMALILNNSIVCMRKELQGKYPSDSLTKYYSWRLCLSPISSSSY